MDEDGVAGVSRCQRRERRRPQHRVNHRPLGARRWPGGQAVPQAPATGGAGILRVVGVRSGTPTQGLPWNASGVSRGGGADAVAAPGTSPASTASAPPATPAVDHLPGRARAGLRLSAWRSSSSCPAGTRRGESGGVVRPRQCSEPILQLMRLHALRVADHQRDQQLTQARRKGHHRRPPSAHPRPAALMRTGTGQSPGLGSKSAC